MVKNTGGQKTNMEVFFEDFIKTTGRNINLLTPIFDEFYKNEFTQLATLFKANPYVKKTVDALSESGYDVVVATNPIFPMEAIKERLKWAGLDYSMFKYITSYENMHYCKPNVEYYNEVLNILNRKPEECIMVGNDEEEDIVASKLGIGTFLVEDCIIRRDGDLPQPDNRGTYVDLYKFILDGFCATKAI